MSVLGKRVADGEAKIDLLDHTANKADLLTDFEHYIWHEEFAGVKNVWHYAVNFKGELVNVHSLFSYIVHSLRFAEKVVNFFISKMNPSDKYLPLDQALRLCLQILQARKIKPSKTRLSFSAQITQAKVLVQDFRATADYLRLQQAPTKARQTFEDNKSITAFMVTLQKIEQDQLDQQQELHSIKEICEDLHERIEDLQRLVAFEQTEESLISFADTLGLE